MGKKIVDIDVLDVEKRRVPSKHYVYVILVKWSDGLSLSVFRRYSRFFDLQATLLHRFPIEGGTIAPEKRIIPFLPGKIFFGRSHIKDVAMKRLDDIRAYCKSLIKLPPHISECEDVKEFFEVEPDDLDPPSSNPDEGKRRLSLSLSLNSLSRSKSSKEKKAEQISKPKRLDRYVAVAEYEAQAPGEMVLYPGLRVDVLEKSDSGWWFVNSEDEQGWVPSTFLEPESEESVSVAPAAIAEPGQEENFICIEKFEAASADEVSLEKGAVVQVLQKNMDGWWLIRYMGREAYAPGTYLKKATNGQTHSMMEKSRLSGVQIISSLQDVSTLLNQDKQNKKNDSPPAVLRSSVGNSGAASALVKTKSLERGGSLIPPPRQNSVTKVDAPLSMLKSSVYVTIEDFEDTVGDGLSFKTGQEVHVKEKTATGWWFVEIDGREGWVPASYLESASSNSQETSSAGNRGSYVSADFSDENWYDHPEMQEEEVPVRPGENSRGYMDMTKRPLPPIPPEEEPSVQQPPKRPSESPRLAHRPLPTAPGPNPGKAGPVLPPTKPASQAKSSEAAAPKVATKPKESPQVQDTAQKPAGSTGDQDLAAILKAKFAARSGASVDSGNSSEEDSSKLSKQSPGRPKVQPMLPKKPSEIKKDLEGSHRPSFNESKASPAQVKSKPLKPPSLPSKPGGANSAPTPGAKPGFPAVKLKPVVKSGPADNNSSSTSGRSSNGPAVPQKDGVKSIRAAFNESGSGSEMAKPAFDKPLVPGKPLSRPKPATQAKPSIAGKPVTPAQKPGQSVNNLTSSLSGKLNFGKMVTENQSKEPSLKPVTPASKPSAASSAPMSRSYVALYDFTAENDGEISFNEGDDLEVLDHQGDWSLVKIWDEEGWAPTNYLQKI